MNDRGNAAAKKPYTPPAVVHTETLTARAVVCIKADVSCDGQGGPVQS